MNALLYLCRWPGLILLLWSLSGCDRGAGTPQVVKAAYYWKSDFAHTPDLLPLIDSAGFQSIYLKYFEVDWNSTHQEARPLDRQAVGRYTFLDTARSFEIIPTVFITNRALLRTDSARLDTLAGLISGKLRAMVKRSGGYHRLVPADSVDRLLALPLAKRRAGWGIGRIQFDCDWTARTRAKYFRLLRLLKQQLAPCEISATIRLYPFRYPEKMGVPPVDRGLLMCYNIRPFDKPDDRSSILDLATARQYLDEAPRYPLPLDIGLPVFSWGVLFRGNQFKGIVNHLTPQTVARLGYFRPQSRRTYVSTADTSFNAFFLRRGDVLRVEQATPDELAEVADLTRDLTTPRSRVALFSLDTALFSHYSHEKLTKVYRRYR